MPVPNEPNPTPESTTPGIVVLVNDRELTCTMHRETCGVIGKNSRAQFRVGRVLRLEEWVAWEELADPAVLNQYRELRHTCLPSAERVEGEAHG